jgi:hemolysin III
MQNKNSNKQIRTELVNSIVHGFGIIFGIVSIPILIALLLKVITPLVLLVQLYMAFVFYNFLLFLHSTHGVQYAQAKRTFEILDQYLFLDCWYLHLFY